MNLWTPSPQRAACSSAENRMGRRSRMDLKVPRPLCSTALPRHNMDLRETTGAFPCLGSASPDKKSSHGEEVRSGKLKMLRGTGNTGACGQKCGFLRCIHASVRRTASAARLSGIILLAYMLISSPLWCGGRQGPALFRFDRRHVQRRAPDPVRCRRHGPHHSLRGRTAKKVRQGLKHRTGAIRVRCGIDNWKRNGQCETR